LEDAYVRYLNGTDGEFAWDENGWKSGSNVHSWLNTLSRKLAHPHNHTHFSGLPKKCTHTVDGTSSDHIGKATDPANGVGKCLCCMVYAGGVSPSVPGKWAQIDPHTSDAKRFDMDNGKALGQAEMGLFSSFAGDSAGTVCPNCNQSCPYEITAQLRDPDDATRVGETITVEQPVEGSTPEIIYIDFDTTQKHDADCDAGHTMEFVDCKIDVTISDGWAAIFNGGAESSNWFTALFDTELEIASAISKNLEIKTDGDSATITGMVKYTSGGPFQSTKGGKIKLTLNTLEQIRANQAGGSGWDEFLDSNGSCGTGSAADQSLEIKFQVGCADDSGGRCQGDGVTLTLNYDIAPPKLEQGYYGGDGFTEQTATDFDLMSDAGEHVPYQSGPSAAGWAGNYYRIVNRGAGELRIAFEATEHKWADWTEGEGGAGGQCGTFESSTTSCWNYAEMYVCEGATWGNCGQGQDNENGPFYLTEGSNIYSRLVRPAESVVINDRMNVVCIGGDLVTAGCQKCNVSIYNADTIAEAIDIETKYLATEDSIRWQRTEGGN
jgi:hypothetical protein